MIARETCIKSDWLLYIIPKSDMQIDAFSIQSLKASLKQGEKRIISGLHLAGYVIVWYNSFRKREFFPIKAKPRRRGDAKPRIFITKTARLPKEGRFFYVQALPMVLPISTKCSEEFFLFHRCFCSLFTEVNVMTFDIIRNEDGQGLTEYALIIALVAIVAVAALTLLGGQINTIFGDINSDLGGGA